MAVTTLTLPMPPADSPRVSRRRPDPRATAERRTRRPAGPGGPASRLALLLCAALLLFGAGLRVADLPLRVHSPDEDTYVTFYAAPLSARGPAHVAELVRDYNQRAVMHDFPPPTRVGHLWMLWVAMVVAGRADVAVASAVSCIAAIAGLVLLARLAWLSLGPWGAAIALGFAATSPLERAMSRRAWGDGPLACVTLLALVALVEHLRATRRSAWGAVALACAAYAVLVKESGALVLVAVPVALAVHAGRAGGARPALAWLGAGCIALAVALGVVTLAAGGIEPLRQVFANSQAAGRTNAYVLQYQTGGPELYLRGFAILQPLPIFLGMTAALIIPWVRGSGVPGSRATRLALAGFAIAFLVVALAWPTKSMRFLSPVYPVLEVLAAGLIAMGLDALRTRIPAQGFRIVVAVVVAALALSGYREHRQFETWYVQREIPDLTTPWLR